MYQTNLNSVALPVPEIISVAEKFPGDGGREWHRPKERWWGLYRHSYRVFLYQHSFVRNFRLWSFGWGLRLGKKSLRGSGVVPFERALVSFYRPSRVAFPLSLRVSEILLLLCSSMPLFVTPPPVSSKFPNVRLGIWWMALGFKEGRCWANCPCNYFLRFPNSQPIWFWSTNVTDGQTGDMQSQDAVCTKGHHAVKKSALYICNFIFLNMMCCRQWNLTSANSNALW